MSKVMDGMWPLPAFSNFFDGRGSSSGREAGNAKVKQVGQQYHADQQHQQNLQFFGHKMTGHRITQLLVSIIWKPGPLAGRCSEFLPALRRRPNSASF